MDLTWRVSEKRNKLAFRSILGFPLLPQGLGILIEIASQRINFRAKVVFNNALVKISGKISQPSPPIVDITQHNFFSLLKKNVATIIFSKIFVTFMNS